MKLLEVFCLIVLLSSCFKGKEKDSPEVKKDRQSHTITNEKATKSLQTLKYFSNIDDFKTFISCKWVDIEDESPCYQYNQSVTVKNGYVHEYNTIEPSQYKINKFIQIDSATLGIKIGNHLDRDVVFKVEVLNFKEKLVKWSLNGRSFKAKPYKEVCIEEDSKANTTSNFNLTWEGAYSFTSSEENEDWREGKSYELYISSDSINLKGYGYQYLENIKCYGIQRNDTLFIYNVDQHRNNHTLLILSLGVSTFSLHLH